MAAGMLSQDLTVKFWNVISKYPFVEKCCLILIGLFLDISYVNTTR